MATLLLCHGIYGYEHQLASGPGLLVAPTTHPDQMHHTSSEEGGTSHHAKTAGGYFAVLISVLLGAILLSWRRSFRVPAIQAMRQITKRPAAPFVAYPPRGPTLYLFQVIRR